MKIHLSSNSVATSSATDIAIRANSPILTMCRRLLSMGVDPAVSLECYRDDMLCLKVRSIGKAAEL